MAAAGWGSGVCGRTGCHLIAGRGTTAALHTGPVDHLCVKIFMPSHYRGFPYLLKGQKGLHDNKAGLF